MPLFLLVKSESDVNAVNYDLIEAITNLGVSVTVLTCNKGRYTINFLDRLLCEAQRGGVAREGWKFSPAYKDFMYETARSRAEMFFKLALSIPKSEDAPVTVVDLYAEVEIPYDYEERCDYFNDPRKGPRFS